jgi:hypothetical protein
MNQGTLRSILRWGHIALSIPIIGYVYSPFEELPKYAPRVRFFFVPVVIALGIWMWKGHALRRLISKGLVATR